MASPVVPPSDIVAPHDNYRTCRLYQIPEELALEVCKLLEGSDVYIMRQTCRIFRRILSSPSFITWKARKKYILKRISIRFFNLPKLPTDWGDVLERLRRGRCCSSCTDVRIAKSPGRQSTYDKVMSRMVNDVRFCASCRVPHPLIMFPHSQRNIWDKHARCILSQGRIAVCPHTSFSIPDIMERMGSVRVGESARILKCDKCFSGIDSITRPSATWRPVTWPRHTYGRVEIEWEIPLRLDKKELFYVKGRMTRGLYGVDAVRVVRKALAKAAKEHNGFLCPHRSFDEERVLWAFKSAYPYKPMKIPISVHRLRTEDRIERLSLAKDHPGGFPTNREARGAHRRRREVADVACLQCNPFCSAWGNHPRWHWVLRDYEDGGLCLQRSMHLFIPNLKWYSPRNYDDWTQMLPPPSYGLPEDKELRHITWCPDKACANGKSWKNHCRVLRKVWLWNTEQYVPPPMPYPACRSFDVEARRVEDPCEYFKALPKQDRKSLSSRFLARVRTHVP